jgi:nitrogen regulatory protein PII-like uncharacterized protein
MDFMGFTWGLGHILGAITIGLALFGVIAFFVKKYFGKDIMPKEMKEFLEEARAKAAVESKKALIEFDQKVHELEKAAKEGLDELYKKFKELF